MTTHDYTSDNLYWGHQYVILNIGEGGLRNRISGWGYGLEAGDYLLMTNMSGETRYQIEAIEYQDNPRDLWFADIVFAPRE